MENEFVVRDPEKLNIAGNTIRTADHVIKVLAETAEKVAATHEDLADAFDAIADLVQVAVMKHTGVDVRRVGSPARDLEIGEIALSSLRTNLGCGSDEDSKKEDEANLRSHVQLVTSSVHLYQDALQGAGTDSAGDLLEKTLVAADSVSKTFGAIESDTRRYFPSSSIVLVEHDRQERDLLQRVLTNHNFEVRSFADDESAIQFVCSHPNDLTMVLNVQNPDTGAATIRRLRGNSRGISISLIGISGTPRDDLQIELGDGGVQCWLQKPFNPAVLLTALQQQGAVAKAA